MKSEKRFLTISLISVLGIIFIATSFGFVNQANGQTKARTLKYESGSFQLRRETKTKITIDQEKITCQPEGGQQFSIPFKSITEVAYDTKAQRRTAEAAALAAFSPLGGLILFSMKKTKHYVSIVWEEDGVTKDAIFLVSKDERTPLLNELQRATGKPWRDLDSEQKRTIQELETAKKTGVSLKLDRAVNVGNVQLKAGNYQIVYLERSNGAGDLHFFEGNKVKPERSIAVAKAETVNQTSNTTQVSYTENAGKSFISEIQTPARTFKIAN